MKKIFFLFSLLVSVKHTFSQSDSVDYYIKKLNWNSFEIFYSFAPKVSITDDGKKLLYFKDSQKISKLIKALSDSQKTVAAHLILSAIFDSTGLGFSLGSQYKDNEAIGTVFRYNQLEWCKNFNGAYSIRKSNVKAIIVYWLKRKESGKLSD